MRLALHSLNRPAGRYRSLLPVLGVRIDPHGLTRTTPVPTLVTQPDLQCVKRARAVFGQAEAVLEHTGRLILALSQPGCPGPVLRGPIWIAQTGPFIGLCWALAS